MFASFAELLNVKLPADAAPDSENLLKTWLNKGGKGREYLVLQNVYNNLSIETNTWKFIAPVKGGNRLGMGIMDQDQLFDLSRDRGEKENVAVQNPKIVEKLRSKLENIKASSIR
jgi:hypothetical protein